MENEKIGGLGMTAKRFMYELHRACFRDNGKAMTTGEVIHTLNELYEENESLKEENKFLRNKVATYKSGNALLKKTLDKEWK